MGIVCSRKEPEKITEASIIKDLSSKVWDIISVSIKKGHTKVAIEQKNPVPFYLNYKESQIMNFINSTYLFQSGMSIKVLDQRRYYSCDNCFTPNVTLNCRACKKPLENTVLKFYLYVKLETYSNPPPAVVLTSKNLM
jgi:hypothetical protein